MGKITFILGGARSGKSGFAQGLAKKNGRKVVFIATCQGRDREMRERILAHRKCRPACWETFEEPYAPCLAIKKINSGFDTIIIDCLTLMVSNLLLEGDSETTIKNKTEAMLKELKKNKAHIIIVSNEVGLGIVPQNKLARKFRDVAGRMNQIVAKEADKVFFLVSGLPWRIK